MPKVADFIDTHRERVIEQFLQEAGKLESARGLKPYELIDTFHEYLATLAAISRQGHRGDPATTKKRLEETHLSLRLRLGYTQEEVTREYLLLGRLISALWEHLPRAEQPPPEDTALFFSELQGAMDTAIVLFSGYSLEDRQAEKRALHRLEEAAPKSLVRSEDPRALSFQLTPLLHIIQEAMGVEGAELLLADANGQTLEFATATGAFPAPAPGYRASVEGPSFVATVARSEEPVYLPDAGYPNLAVRDEVRGSGLHSLLGLRLWPHGKLMGILTVAAGWTRSFEPQARRFFETLVEYLSGILDRALLVGELQERNAQLRESEQRLRLVIDSLPGLVNFVDSEQRYQLNNKAYEQWFGIPAERLRGRTVRELLGEESYQRILPWVERALRGERVTYQSPFRFLGGREGFIEATFVPQVASDGKVLGYVSLITDITERRRRREQEQHRAEFEQQLIGIVSHDLRNPLNAITLAAAALLRQAGLGERQVSLITRIVSAADRANRLIRDLLDFTRARLGGGIPLKREPFALHGLARQVADEVQLNYPEREFQLRLEGDSGGEWDSDRMAQVLTNLLSNAAKYSPPGTPVRLGVRGEGEGVFLEVHNQGEPIPPEQLPLLFQPFHRGAQQTDSESRSVGLGLYIVDQIVRAHGGTLEVSSSWEEGTMFRLWLPRQATVP